MVAGKHSQSSNPLVSPGLLVCQTRENRSLDNTLLSANRNKPCPRSNCEHASTSDFTRAALVVTASTRKRWMPRRCR